MELGMEAGRAAIFADHVSLAPLSAECSRAHRPTDALPGRTELLCATDQFGVHLWMVSTSLTRRPSLMWAKIATCSMTAGQYRASTTRWPRTERPKYIRLPPSGNPS